MKCIISQNNTKTTLYLNRALTIKDIRILISKKLDIDIQSDENKSNLTKSDNLSYNKDKTPKNNINNSQNENAIKEEKNETIKSLEVLSNGKKRHKKISLFFKGKELTNDEEIIGNLVSNNGIEELELSVIILSLNDSSFIDENKTKEKLINKISNKCLYHKNNKELFICTTCNVAFCKYCLNKHKSHEIIERKDIVKFNNELKNLNSELNKKLTEANLTNVYERKESQNTEYNTSIEKLQNRLDNIKKIHRGIINNYKRDIDKSLPYLLEYKEKVEQLIENSYNLDTLKDDQQFIDYYYWYINIKQKQEKISKEIQDLEKIQSKFEEMMNFFDEKLKEIHKKTDNDYKLLKNLYYNNNIQNQNENLFKDIQSLSDNDLPKLNLINLFNKSKNPTQNILNSNNKSKNQPSKELKEINNNEKDIKKMKKSISFRNNDKNDSSEKVNNILSNSFNSSKFFTKKKSNKNCIFEKIEEKSEKEESLDDISLNSQKLSTKIIYNINPKTKNIFCFDIKSKKIEEKKVNFEDLSIEAFQEDQGILNYKNNFYISGGNNLQIFYKYNQILNKFLKLKEMPSIHSSHGMLGMGNYIFAIGGNSSKKVEKYDINENKWEKLHDLNEIRIWPSCFGYNKKYIFVFGGIKRHLTEQNVEVEKIDISSPENKWEKINFKHNKNPQLPNNYGFINFRDNQFIIIGGKYNDENKNKENDSFMITIKNKGIDIEKENNLTLNKKDEFNGKLFTHFGNGLYGEFSSTSYRTFYLINILTKKTEEIN